MENDRRLGDRILFALELALDQEELEIAESLATALTLCLTRFGGANAVERRPEPRGLEEAYDRLDALRHSKN